MQLTVKLDNKNAETKLEICEGDSLPDLVTLLSSHQKMSTDMKEAIETYIERKLEQEGLIQLVTTSSVGLSKDKSFVDTSKES